MELLAGAAAAAWSGGELFLQPGELHVRQGHGVGSIVLALKLVVSNLMLLNCYYTK